MTSFIHLSDIHLGATTSLTARDWLGKRPFGYLNWQRRRHLFDDAVLSTLMQDAHGEAREVGCELWLLGGDLVNLAQDAEIDAATTWLATQFDRANLPTASEVVLVPGNHDYYVKSARASLTARWAPWLFGDEARSSNARASPEKSQNDQPDIDRESSCWPRVLVRGSLCIIAISTAEPRGFFDASGSVGAAQMDRLHGQLVRMRDKNVVLLMHHPVTADGKYNQRRDLRDSSDLLKVLEDAPPRLILHGHNHRSRWEELGIGNRRVLISAPSSASMRADSNKEAACYNIFSIEGNERQGAVHVRNRRITDDMKMEEAPARSFAWSQ